MLIPTSDRRIDNAETILIIHSHYNPFFFIRVHDGYGGFIFHHPSFANIGRLRVDDGIYIYGWYPTVYREGRFRYLGFETLFGNQSSAAKLPDGYVMAEYGGSIEILDLNGRIRKAFMDWTYLYSFTPIAGGYVGSTPHLIAIVDESFNTVKTFKPKGQIVWSVAYDGSNYYTTEDDRYVRKYDSNGILIAEAQLIYGRDVIVGGDGYIYVGGDIGISKYDSNLNLISTLSFPGSIRIVEHNGSIYAYSQYLSKLLVIDVSTGNLISQYSYDKLMTGLWVDSNGIYISALDPINDVSYIEVRDLNFNLVSSYNSNDVPLIYGAGDIYRIPGTNIIVYANHYYAYDILFDISTGQPIASAVNFYPYDVEVYGGRIICANPFLGVLSIFDLNLNFLGNIGLNAPFTLTVHEGKLYVSDFDFTKNMNRILTFDMNLNLVEQKYLTEFETYVQRIGRWSRGFYATDVYNKVVFYDWSWKALKAYSVMEITGGVRDAIVDVAEFDGKLFFAGNRTMTIYVHDGGLTVKYTSNATSLDSMIVHPSGRLILCSPSLGIRVLKDYNLVKTVPIATSYLHPSKDWRHYTSTYVAPGFSVLIVFNENLNVEYAVQMDGVSVWSAIMMGDGTFILGERGSMSLINLSLTEGVRWILSLPFTPRFSPNHNYDGVWVYGAGRIFHVDMNGNINVFADEPKTIFTGVYDDGRYLYVLTIDGELRRYSYDGRYKLLMKLPFENSGISYLYGSIIELKRAY
ncbi:MAG: hypothetical protein OH337_04170 [Candidatus Parvarchaeota archaeon]|nr:hypothetical protein [Candidatus Haiyanarchaeum thermophilum]